MLDEHLYKTVTGIVLLMAAVILTLAVRETGNQIDRRRCGALSLSARLLALCLGLPVSVAKSFLHRF